jgi:hypothetical protein
MTRASRCAAPPARRPRRTPGTRWRAPATAPPSARRLGVEGGKGRAGPRARRVDGLIGIACCAFARWSRAQPPRIPETGVPATPPSASQPPTCGLGERAGHQQDLRAHAPGEALVQFWEPQVVAHRQAQHARGAVANDQLGGGSGRVVWRGWEKVSGRGSFSTDADLRGNMWTSD